MKKSERKVLERRVGCHCQAPLLLAKYQSTSQVSKLITLKCSAEIQALDQFGHTFLLEKYILEKLLDGTDA